VNQAPLVDSHDVTTMQILLAMGDGGPAGKHRDAWDRGSKWLQETPVRDETQPIAYRLLIASRCRNQEGVQKGWSSFGANSRRTEVGARSRSLPPMHWPRVRRYLPSARAGVGPDDTAVRQAWSFLASTQEENGSWVVHTQNPNSHDPVISYFGTGWGTLGLMRTLPTPSVVP